MDLTGLKAKADEYQRTHRLLAFLYGVVKKFGEDSSSNLAVLITYYAFFSIFPLLITLASILGFLLKGHPSWTRRVNQTTLKDFPFFNGHLPQHGSVALVVIGTLLALYSGLGVAKAAQQAWNVVYCVPKSQRPGFLTANLRALRLVGIGGLSLIATTVASSIIASAGVIGVHIGVLLSLAGYVVTIGLNAVTFMVVFRWLTVREVSFRDVMPGAVLCAVALFVLQTVSSAFISHKAAGANATYGSFGTVIILLSWFYLQSQVLLFAAQVNVVKQDHLWPRSFAEPETE
jgi:membrane protein